jgi:hypothetical protein
MNNVHVSTESVFQRYLNAEERPPIRETSTIVLSDLLQGSTLSPCHREKREQKRASMIH